MKLSMLAPSTTAYLLLAALLPPFCQARYDEATERRVLDKNRRLWHSYAGTEQANYDMEFERSCYCMEEYRGPFDMEIRLGVVSRASYKGDTVGDSNSLNRLLSVEKAFDTIQTALDDTYHDLRVEYDKAAGYPKSVYIDRKEMIADDEVTYLFRNFKLMDDSIVVGTGEEKRNQRRKQRRKKRKRARNKEARLNNRKPKSRLQTGTHE